MKRFGITETEEYTERAKQFSEDGAIEPVREVLDCALAEDPEKFLPVPGTKLRRIDTPTMGSIPALDIYYTIDDPNVVLVWVEAAINQDRPSEFFWSAVGG